jgi:hypothetical protein
MLIALFLLATGCSKKEQAEEKPGVARAATVTLAATVSEVDYEDRILALTDDAGNIRIIEVSDKVKNFDQIAVGDQVKVTFYESFVAYVTPPGEETPPDEQTEVVGVAAPGEMPGMVAIDTHQGTATVEAIDVANRMVSLKGPEGNVVTLPVKEDVKNLDKVKVGDQVTYRFTKAMAIAVEEVGGTQ